MTIEYTIENATKILRFLGFELDQNLRVHFNHWYSFYRERRIRKQEFFEKNDNSNLRELGILPEDFEFVMDVANAYHITYGNHSKNRDKKYIASKKSDVIMDKAVTSGLWGLLRDGIKVDDLKKFCNQNSQQN